MPPPREFSPRSRACHDPRDFHEISHGLAAIATASRANEERRPKAPLGSLILFEFSELLEIAAVAHRDDDALRRHDYPASILPLDLLHRSEPRQRRAGHDLIDVAAMTLHIDITVASIADRPIRHDREPRRRR